MDVAVGNNGSPFISGDINTMGASPSYYEAVKICNGSLHSPTITRMGNQMVRERPNLVKGI